jgi:hypothetical protein
MCYLTRTVPFARVVSIASDFVYRLVVKAFLVLATVLRNLRHRVTGKGSVVRCVYGRAEAVQRLCRVEGEENFRERDGCRGWRTCVLWGWGWCCEED